MRDSPPHEARGTDRKSPVHVCLPLPRSAVPEAVLAEHGIPRGRAADCPWTMARGCARFLRLKTAHGVLLQRKALCSLGNLLASGGIAGGAYLRCG